MKLALVYHHLGLGDHIICSGIVRHIYDQYEGVHLFCKSHNLASIRDLYADLPNLILISADDNYAGQYIACNGSAYKDIIKIGFTLNTTASFEKQFYDMAQLPLSTKWDNFILPYDYGLVHHKSHKLFDSKNLSQSYIFVHDDSRFPIDINKIKKEKYIFRVKEHPANSIIEYADIIRNASEIHVIDSAFLFLIDCWDYEADQQLFIHRYARHNDDWLLPTLRKNWTILE